MKLSNRIREKLAQLPTKRRQYLFAAAVGVGGLALFWVVLSMRGDDKPATTPLASKIGQSASVTTVASPGQVAPLDEWVGTAGKKMTQLLAERAAQDKINSENKAAYQILLKRMAELEKSQQAAPAPPVPVPVPPVPATSARAAPAPAAMPPGQPLGGPAGAFPDAPPPVAPVTRVSLVAAPSRDPKSAAPVAPDQGKNAVKGNTGTFLPVSIIRAQVLGGIDAPTGGQAQSNPLPTLLRVTNNAILPNRFRAQVKECFIIGAGYGDVSSERAYIRTASLSCVRLDGSTLEVDIKGNVYGEDGKLGMRGKLVTKQGQILANALRAGIVSGIGQGFSQSGSTFSTGAFGTVATQSGDPGDQFKRGMATGVGRAMDSLAAYYVKLADNTFPIIEIDASREVDVVITKGVYIPTGTPDRDSDSDTDTGSTP